ncbi:hypothetical protein FCL40_13525 [Ferrimonas sediminicola]|uniref:Uncharacterized protein n=1 Tax=Ferrimonas sediminicola TaxID=2569538 RepID=A0A4U1BB58_9GAMM|nr:hypothetical protein [Ferrimonas sediminicola]TKB48144.1 hypothetical protein FCL40_13525 [Ferrimonas sediminicola]
MIERFSPSRDGFLRGHGLVVTSVFLLTTILSISLTGQMAGGLFVAGVISVFFQVRDKGNHAVEVDPHTLSGMMGELGDSPERGRIALALEEIDLSRSRHRTWLDTLCFSYRVHTHSGRSVVVSGTLFGLTEAPRIHRQILDLVDRLQSGQGGERSFMA